MAGEVGGLPALSLVEPLELAAAEQAWQRRHPGGVVVGLRGSRSSDRSGLFAEAAAALAFPGWFGWNWDAFADCLTDLSWLPASSYLLVIDEADLLLKDSPDELPVLLDVLRAAANHWAAPPAGGGRQPVPFATVLVAPA